MQFAQRGSQLLMHQRRQSLMMLQPSLVHMQYMQFAAFERLVKQQKERGELLPFTINNLWDNPGARQKRRRVGRGPGSTKGKTSGRGHKGQYARSGGSINRGFEGGQTPMAQRFPKYGFRKHRFGATGSKELEQLNLGKVAYHIEKGDLDTSKTITMQDLFQAGALSQIKHGVKLLSKGSDKFR